MILIVFEQIVLGWAGDCVWVDAGLVYALSMALCGAVIALVPLIRTYEMLCVVSGAFGLFIAANYSLTSIILVELITLERFTNAYGLLLLVQGVANLVGPPLAGLSLSLPYVSSHICQDSTPITNSPSVALKYQECHLHYCQFVSYYKIICCSFDYQTNRLMLYCKQYIVLSVNLGII